MCNFASTPAPQSEEAIITEFQERLRRWHPRKGEDLDEVIGNTLLAYSKAKHEGRRFDRPLCWLLRTAKHQRNQWHRSEEAERRAIKDTWSPPSKRHNKRLWTPAFCDNSNAELRREIDLNSIPEWKRLAPDRQELLVLVHVGDWSVKQASASLGVKRPTAKSWAARDLQRLRKSPVLRRLVSSRV